MYVMRFRFQSYSKYIHKANEARCHNALGKGKSEIPRRTLSLGFKMHTQAPEEMLNFPLK